MCLVANCVTSNFLRVIQLCFDEVLQYIYVVDDDYTNNVVLAKVCFLFADMPAFCLTTAYVLLFTIMMHSIRQSKRHWLPMRRFRIDLGAGFVCFVVTMYLTQLLQYGFLAFPILNQRVLNLWINSRILTMILGVPLVAVVMAGYETFQLSGFPLADHASVSRSRHLITLFLIWTAAYVFLSAQFMEGVHLSQFGILLVTEIAPVACCYSTISSVAFLEPQNPSQQQNAQYFQLGNAEV